MDQWIARHVAHMHSQGLAKDTIEDRQGLLIRIDRELPMGVLEATVEELENWLANPDWCNQTKATYYGHLVAFYRWAADPKRIPHMSYDPSLSLTRPKVPAGMPRPVTDEQLATILDRAAGRWRIFCLLAAYAGLRSCEIATAEKGDNLTEKIIIIRGKGGKQRLIPTHPAIWESVRRFPDGRIALNHGLPVTAKWVSTRTGMYLRRIGIEGVALHRIRHWFATSALNSGASLRTVQELLGHASPATTAIYTQVSDEQRKTAISTLPVLAPPASKQ